jgi:hypothetical protein
MNEKTIDEIEEVSDEELEAAGAGAWTIVCTGGFQCNSYLGCFNEKSRLRNARAGKPREVDRRRSSL